MSDLAFLSPGRASAEATWRSPLERALRGAPPEISDLSLTGKIEIRGDLPKSVKRGELVRITPNRGLVLCDFTKTVELLDNRLAACEHAENRIGHCDNVRNQRRRSSHQEIEWVGEHRFHT